MVACSVLSVLWPLKDEERGQVRSHPAWKTDPCPKKIRSTFDPINAGKDVIVVSEGKRERAAGLQQ